MSRHRKFIAVKRHMRRLVPALKNASAAARVVTTPAASAEPICAPGSVDCATPTSCAGSERSTPSDWIST